jgi:hypothetical protein
VGHSSDDQVGESFLSDGFELTCRAWEVRKPFLQTVCVLLTELLKSRFGTPYAHCGCALPVSTIIEEAVQFFEL